MAHSPRSATAARFDPAIAWQERRRRPGSPNPFAVRRPRDAVRFDDEDFSVGAPPMTRRLTDTNQRSDASGFGLMLAAVAVALIVVLLIAMTLWI